MRRFFVAPVFLSVGLMSGCAGSLNPVGDSNYGCPGMPEGVVCKSPSEVYRMGPEVTKKSVVTEEKNESFLVERLHTPEGAPASYLPKPVIEPAKILRIWIAPWQDAKKDLHWPSYIYSELRPRAWAYGDLDFSISRPIVPYGMGDFAPVPAGGLGSSQAAGKGNPVSSVQPQPGQALPAPTDNTIFAE